MDQGEAQSVGEPVRVISDYLAKLARDFSLARKWRESQGWSQRFFCVYGLLLLTMSVMTHCVSVVSNRLDEERAQNLMEVVEQAL